MMYKIGGSVAFTEYPVEKEGELIDMFWLK